MTDKKKETGRTQNEKEQPGRKRPGADPFAEYTDEYKKTRTRSAGEKAGGAEAGSDGDPRRRKMKKAANPSSIGNQIFIALLVALAVFIELCFLIPEKMGKIGAALVVFLPGIGGGAVLAFPVLLLFHALYWKRDTVNGMRLFRFTFSFSLVFFLSVFVHLIFVSSGVLGTKGKLWALMTYFYERGGEYAGGGAVGGAVATLLIRAFGIPGAYVFSVLFLLISVILFIGLTPSAVWQRLMFYLMRAMERYRRLRAEKRKARREKEAEEAAKKAAAKGQIQSYGAQKNGTHGHAVIDGSILDGSGIREGREENPDSRDRFADLSGGTVRKKAVKEEPAGEQPRKRQSAPLDPFGYDTEPGAENTRSEKKKTENPLMITASNIGVPSSEGQKTSYGAEKTERSRVAFDYDVFPADGADKEASASEKPVSAYAGTAGEKKKNVSYSAPVFRSEESKPAAVILGGETDVEREEGEGNDVSAAKAPAAPAEPVLPPYRFPPISLLKTAPASAHRNREELEANGAKLIETLANFNVHAKLAGISCGPTITRYEITLEAGTRVRALTNLVDDISLALATEGVRIEGVIAGKSAIGIEVPNRTSEFVYVRDLIDSPAFENAKSRLTTALGKGVAGEPVYLDIAKMPHLLIAGTTGSGKSVCINSLLISILYKARPEDVKLVLIDPKKVELNMYNGLPHLLVPVVFDPKKAAGALNWCVTEMERRFDLIEEVGAKNLETYTKAIENDPTKERLPQIVIVIDELADLMMTAADAVETSICRIAQKARAAGMHLIVGTQRPSVDVVTGLIKANIPSRIAFTVKSQVDSRTIIDVAGAEKLVGHGDMLYAPIGSMKPIRVQGAFVSEGEIDAVIDFMKENNSEDVVYSDDVMEQIEKEAALCGPKKSKAAWNEEPSDEPAGADKSDPMFDKAVELAVESGKISTSYIQRRLSLGFGRAAKLIDMMEERGIVSGPDGQKPRTTLITREQYLEMKMLDSSDS